jgi:hypothetical protein
VGQEDPGEEEWQYRDKQREDNLFRSSPLIPSRWDVSGKEESVDNARRKQIADQQKARDQRTHGLGGFADDAEAMAAPIGEEGNPVFGEVAANGVNLLSQGSFLC